MTRAATASAFPRRSAATRRFTLGAPRHFSVSPDGSRALFLRAPAGADPLQALWALDLRTGLERRVADPASLDEGDGSLPAAEQARRERVRELAGGIVGYATDRELRRAVFALTGALYLADIENGRVRRLDLPGPAVDPRLDPDGGRLAWVAAGRLLCADLAAGDVMTLAADPDPDVAWGLPEFIAAEEMRRSAGYWWAPDGRRLLAARVSEAPVTTWHLAEPAEPARAPARVRFPAAGTANADVSLALVGLDGTQVPVRWDRAALPYLAQASWQAGHPPTIAVQSRDQRRLDVLTVDEGTGETALVRRVEGEPWVELVPGLPRWDPGGGLLTARDDPRAGPHGTRRLLRDGEAISPAGLQLRAVAGADASGVLVSASAADPTEIGVWRIPLDGTAPERLDPAGGVGDATGTPAAFVRTRADLQTAAAATAHAGGRTLPIASHAEEPPLSPRVELLELGADGLRAALLLPHGHEPSDAALPVLLDPYGGPHAQRVLRSRNAFLSSQWFADAGGYAVLVIDGRGTPGRGPSWEHAVAGDLAGPALDDQVAGLTAAAERLPGVLDLSRVAIRGWSFGGYLAALAVLRRPDVFHAAVAGAPVTDWRLYDTHYTERYLGHPERSPEAYERSSLLGDAPGLARPLLLIHGFADDNVVAAHTYRLSRALMEAGRPHEVLPLSGVTHMTPQEVVAEHLLTLQLDFLRRALGGGQGSRADTSA